MLSLMSGTALVLIVFLVQAPWSTFQRILQRLPSASLCVIFAYLIALHGCHSLADNTQSKYLPVISIGLVTTLYPP